ncbi:MAG: LysR family transcriptional regulator [Betaproteobacteria bacterium]
MTAADHLLARLRFRHLRMVSELKRSGSMRAAAGALHLTQPALSKALKELEAAFGFALFERSARGLRATRQGAVVLRGAAVLLAELDHLQQEARAAMKSGVTVLRLGAPPLVALGIVPAVLARLLARDPPVFTELHEHRVPHLFEALLKGELDALLTTYNAAMMSVEAAPRLRYEKFHEEELVLIAPPGHRLATIRRATWPELAQAPWILPEPSSFVRQMITASFGRAGIVPPEPVVQSASTVTNVRLVAQGLGIAAVPAETMREAEHMGSVARIRIYPAVAPIPVALVYRAAAADHPRIAYLRTALSLAAVRGGSSRLSQPTVRDDAGAD